MEHTNIFNELTDNLKTKFSGAILGTEQYDIPALIAKKERLIELVAFLKSEGFNFLTDLTGIHYPNNKGNELGVVYHFHDMPRNIRLRLKIYTSLNEAHVPTLTGLFPGANWMERETFDFYGIIFTGHPNLKRILNMDEMNYFPMRKEYPLEDAKRDDKDDTMFGREDTV